MLISSSALLPAPFHWVDIPAGKVTLVSPAGWTKNYIPEGESQIYEVPAFAITKYPVTNAQYQVFVDADGYREQRWWTETGWQQRQVEGWRKPRYWRDQLWNGAEQPVVGISWFEAVAFCQWLSETVSETILLPTEQQWQRAAQGDDGRTYPWGNEWECQRCNSSVKPCDSSGTTPVRQYDGKGDSPFGVADMAGNVWEWCLTAYLTGKHTIDGIDARVLRGGSWNDNLTVNFQCVWRDADDPYHWNNLRGFRLSRTE